MPAKRKSSAKGGSSKKSKAAAPCSFGFSYEAGTEVPAGPGAKYRDELAATAKAIACGGKGILAADESNGTVGKRFAPIGVENTEENRRAYRELLFTTKNLSDYISGCIVFDETIRQSTKKGKIPFPKLLTDQDIVVGIKVDKGIQPLSGSNGESYCTGLDGLGARCAEYYELGARFAKWRAVLQIPDGAEAPSEQSIRENAYGLARYAATCQENGLVPIVEPEILMDGEHDIGTAQAAAEKVWNACYKALADQHVFLEGTLLKPAMVVPGAQCKSRANDNAEAIALATVTALRRAVPAAMPGVVFLSGGQSEEDASLNLSAINVIGAQLGSPWCAATHSPFATWQTRDLAFCLPANVHHEDVNVA
jgi:fructose-bisphosphate aldolase class I